ncbi:hypothetical protein ACOCG7_07785 [Paraburkholderia sp. DD10]
MFTRRVGKTASVHHILAPTRPTASRPTPRPDTQRGKRGLADDPEHSCYS